MTSTPADAEALARLLAAASSDGRRVAIAGRGSHGRAGRPEGTDLTIRTAGLDQVVDYVPEDLTITVQAGMPVESLSRRLAERGQCWPQVDEHEGGTVGGVLATAASGRRRLGFGPVRDSLLRVVLATGDGRLVAGGGATVKGVAGYDLPRLAVGSHGTLGVIVEATLKLWPRPVAGGWFCRRADLAERLAVADRLRRRAPQPVAVLVRRDGVFVALVGPTEDVAPPEGFAPCAAPPRPPVRGRLDVGVSPSAVGAAVEALDAAGLAYEAQAGVGAVAVAVAAPGQLRAARDIAADLGGHAALADGGDHLRAEPWGARPAGLDIMRRLRGAFDPAGVLNPGRFIGALA